MAPWNQPDGCVGIKRRNEDLVERSVCPGCHGSNHYCKKRLCADNSLLVNEDGQTPLHVLCQDRCSSMEEVQNTVASFPEALELRDVYGRSPLFYALKRACSIEVVTFLFDCFPDAILFKDFCGDSPLYLLYHSSKDYKILEHVLSQMPSLAVYKEATFSAQPLVKRICAPWTSNQLALTRNDVDTNATLKDRWTKLVVTVRAAHAFTTGQQYDDVYTQMPELHLALKFACPPLALCYFTQMYPDQVSMMMAKEGCYPLHYFLSEYDISRDSKAVVQSLVAAFPQAVNRRVNNDRLPIHLAISPGRKWQDGIEDIVYAGPDGLDCPDPQSGLIPFLHAASMECCDMSTVYNLLRENPAVIATLQ